MKLAVIQVLLILFIALFNESDTSSDDKKGPSDRLINKILQRMWKEVVVA
jgi:hypothetical protein